MRAYDGIKAERGHEVTLETPDFLEHARHSLSKNSTIAIRMSGNSMRPAISDGDVVVIESIQEQTIKPGDVILYHTVRETAVIHRVVRVERSSSERTIITRGDAAFQNDVPVPPHRILGRVKLIERAGERIDIARPKHQGARRLAALLRRLFSRSGETD